MRKKHENNSIDVNTNARETLYDAITNMNEELIEKAETYAFSKKDALRKNESSSTKRGFHKYNTD